MKLGRVEVPLYVTFASTKRPSGSVNGGNEKLDVVFTMTSLGISDGGSVLKSGASFVTTIVTSYMLS